jgi:hypothetical protein
MVFLLVVLSLLVLLIVFLEPPLVLLISLHVVSCESNLSLSLFLFCCVIYGLLPDGLDLSSVLPRVFEPILVLVFSLNAASRKSNPPFLLCCVVDGLLPNGLHLHSVIPHVF